MIVRVRDFDHWRSVARQLIGQGVAPAEVTLREADSQPSLFADDDVVDEHASEGSPSQTPFSVPRSFLALAQEVAYHRDAHRWNRLYRTLWRLLHEQPHLLEISTDDDIHELRRMEKQVRRDAHKMKAFVRFRRVVRDGDEFFVAWHRADHYVLRKVAPFFARRFKGMNWSILTPDESASWDQHTLRFGPGAPRSEAPDSDQLETLWQTYYSSIFNPARVKVKAMKNEMPVRYWSTMPETELIPELVTGAPERVEQMIANSEGYQTSAADYIALSQQQLGRNIATLDELANLAASCTACDLHCTATQTVFGEGPPNARLVVVGEQPGDVEDQRGRPFVGPAGQVLNEAFAAAGVRREDVYLTNVVKHFKHTLTNPKDSNDVRGKKRLHKKPNASEVRVCKPWLTAEWELLKQAAILVCLGSTAATALISPEFKIGRDRGRWFSSQLCPQTIATWHPAAILRMRDEQRRKQMMTQLTHDLYVASQRYD